MKHLKELLEEYERKNPGSITSTAVSLAALAPAEEWHVNPLFLQGNGKRPKTRKSKNNWLRLDLTLPVPPGTNNLFINARGRSRGRIKSPDYREWIERAKPYLDGAGKITHKPFCVTIVLPANIRKNSDVANREKAVTDLLVACGTIPGDSIAKGLYQHTQRYDPNLSGDLCRVTVEAM